MGESSVTKGVEAAELVRRIGAGEMRAADLTAEERRGCVEYLTREGFTNDQIVGVLGVSERTVTRDRAEARRERGLGPDRRLGDELLGEFQEFVLASMQRLTRLSRDEGVSAYARLWAEESMSRIYQRLIETARKMEYFEGGGQRLARQREEDPAEIEWRKRKKEEKDAEIRRQLKGPFGF